MNLHCVGINHRTAPLEVREKLWFSTEEVRSAVQSLHEKQLPECVLISTCNRTEVYFHGGELEPGGRASARRHASLRLKRAVESATTPTCVTRCRS